MSQKPRGRTSSSEQVIRDIKRKTRKQYSAEEKIRLTGAIVRQANTGEVIDLRREARDHPVGGAITPSGQANAGYARHYQCFNLSARDIEDLMSERGIAVSYEAI